MPPTHALESDRVRLEPIDEPIAAALLAGRPEPGLAWEEGFPMPPLLDFLRRATGEPDGPALGPYTAYIVVRRADGLAVGDAGFHGPPGDRGEVEVGYALVPAARGAGLATESVGLLARWALAQPGIAAVSARVQPANAASVRVLERLGFAADGERAGHARYVLRR
jgi:RimJ/RimL family protein N-acetyltransferase